MSANDLATFADYRRLILDSMGGRRKYVPLVVFLGVVAAIVEGFGIGLVIPVIGIIIDDARPAGGIGAWFASIGAGWDPALRLLLLAGLVIVFVASKNVLTYFNSVLVSYLFGQAGHRTRLRLARRVLTLDYRTIVTEPPGHVLNILSNESWRMSDAVQLLLRLIVAASASLIFLLILFLLSWWLTLGVLVGTIIVQLVHHVLSSRLKSVGRRLTTNNHALASRMLHLVSAGKLIRLFGRHESELEWFGNHSERVREAALSLDRRKAVLPALTEVLNIILFFAITVAAWNAGLTFAVIVSFIVLLYRMQPQVREMQMHWAQLQGLTGSLEEVQRLLDMEGANRRSGTFREHERVESAIEFDDVTFFYPGQEGEEPVLRNVSFTLPEGRSVALVGPSGSGKSTIVNLLCGFFQPTSGLIRIDGQPLGTLSPGSWRRKMALASQELELADGTIAENIAYGREDASKDEIENAARMAEAHDFITTFPSGYETNVGFRGASLSGGQRQRIALARALVRHPDFLILDEATNALDGISERAIIHTLRARTGKGTTLVISHHDSGLASCDTIIRIAGGRLVE